MSDKKPRKAAIIFILITILIDVLAIGIVIPVLPGLVKELLGENSQQASWYVGVIAASYALMQFTFAPIFGAVSDRVGRRPILLLSMFGLGADFIIQGFAPNVWWLLGGRIFAGIMGASFTTANAYIADISTDENRAQNFGLVGVAFGLGFIIGPTLGGYLGADNLRLPFFVSAALALLNWLYGAFVLPESLTPENRSKSIQLKSLNPFGSISRLGVYPIVAGLATAMVCMSLAQRGLENVWVLFTEYRYGWDRKYNGLMLGLVGVMAMLVQGGMVRPMIKRFGERRTVLGGAMISCLAFFGYAFAFEGWMIPCVIIFGAFGGVARPAIQSIITKEVDASEQGQVQGALTSLISLTNIVAPLFFTSLLFDHFTSETAKFKFAGAPFFAGAILILLAMVIIRRVFKRIPVTPTAVEPDAVEATA